MSASPLRPKLSLPLLITFGAIFLLAASLRLHHLTQLFHWTLDEEYWAYVAYNIATGYHFPLIGGPISGTGLYTGSLFAWFTGIIFWLIGSNPARIALLVSLTGAITAAAIFVLLKTYIKPKVALLASLIYSVSTLAILYDRKFWNASFIPLLSLLVLHLLFKLKTKASLSQVIALALCSALALQSHMSGLTILLFALLSLIKTPSLRSFVPHFFLVFLVLFSPLLIFEFRHNFPNTQALATIHTSPATSQNLLFLFSQPVNLAISTSARFLFTPCYRYPQ